MNSETEETFPLSGEFNQHVSDLKQIVKVCQSHLRTFMENEQHGATNGYWAAYRVHDFNLWCANAGIKDEGSWSFNSRLEDVPECLFVLDILLQSLRRDLTELEAAGLQVFQGGDGDGPHGPPPQDHPSAETYDDLGNKTFELQNHVRDTIKRLHRHNIHIDQARAKRLQQRIDAFSKEREQKYRGYMAEASQSARNRYPSASETLQRRIAESVIRRKIRFEYAKATRGSSGEQRDETKPDSELDPSTLSIEFSADAKSILEKTSESSVKHTRRSWREAETRPIEADMEAPLLGSASTHSQPVKGQPVGTDIEIPPPPKFDGEGFRCPYCFFNLSAREADKDRWTRHVLDDLQPYFCTWEDCKNAFDLPNSFRGLLDHLQGHNPASYHVNMPDGQHAELDENQFEEYLTAHGIPTEEHASCAENSLRREPFIFQSCPFCDAYSNGIDTFEAQNDILHHIKMHMHQIALLSFRTSKKASAIRLWEVERGLNPQGTKAKNIDIKKASTTTKRHFSLLVGVDAYFNDEPSASRKFMKGYPVSLNDLHGAVNDVEVMRELLEERFSFEKPTILSSPPSEPNLRSPQQLAALPTYANIKEQMGEIYKEASEGDVFLFFFAGHGAILQTLEASPTDGRKGDPALLTADYCHGKRAVRGWELNGWLKQFGEKGVRVVVIIDSCHSEKAWRNDRQQRTPTDWFEPVPNIRTDWPKPSPTPSKDGVIKETASASTKGGPWNRDAELEKVWDLDLRTMTVMTACKSTQTALEHEENGKVYGAFTLALAKYLRTHASVSTYRTLRDGAVDYLSAWEIQQSPQVFGQDRFAFLQDFEPVRATPIPATLLEDGRMSLGAGKMHGIYPNTEFVSTSEVPVKVSITDTDDYMSTAETLEGSVLNLSSPIQLVPSRWSMVESLKVTVDPDLGPNFKARLDSELEKRLIRQFYYDERSVVLEDDDTESIHLHLEKANDNGINILGQQKLTKNGNLVRGWKLEGRSDEERATESAIAIRHLYRFWQIRRLQSKTNATPQFDISVSKHNMNPGSFNYVFQNKGNRELHIAVFILSAGFHVKQLYPTEDKTEAVGAFGEEPFGFRLKAPDKSKTKQAVDEQQKYCETIRTVVMRGKSVSMKSIELPDIWNAGEWEKLSFGAERDGEVVPSFDWWIHDEDVTYMG